MPKVKRNVRAAMLMMIEFGWEYMLGDVNSEQVCDTFGVTTEEMEEAYNRLKAKLPKGDDHYWPPMPR